MPFPLELSDIAACDGGAMKTPVGQRNDPLFSSPGKARTLAMGGNGGSTTTSVDHENQQEKGFSPQYRSSPPGKQTIAKDADDR
jgi:hypothetical protein